MSKEKSWILVLQVYNIKHTCMVHVLKGKTCRNHSEVKSDVIKEVLAKHCRMCLYRCQWLSMAHHGSDMMSSGREVSFPL